MMKKFMALHLSIFSIALFGGLIIQHEWHLAKVTVSLSSWHQSIRVRSCKGIIWH